MAVEVFDGNTADPATLAAQIDQAQDALRAARVCLVADRGMLTSARIGDELRPADLDWITALRAPQIKALVEGGRAAAVAVRRAGPGRDHPPGLSRRAAGLLPQPGPGRRARPQTRGAAGRHRERAGQDRRGHRRERRPLRGRDKIALPGGQGDQPAQDGQALHHRDHRRGVQLRPRPRHDRRRGRPRRHLRAAHQPAPTHT